MRKTGYGKKVITVLMAAVCTMAAVAGCGSSGSVAGTGAGENNAAGAEGSQELNLFTWDGMFPQEVLDAFEEEYQIKINYSNFDYDEDMLAKLETAKGGDYDVIIADDYIIEIAIEEGLVQKLDHTAISNFGNVDPAFQGQFYDPTDEYTVPYGAGIPLIVYDPAMVDLDIKSYGDLWDSSLEDNVALIGNYRVINGITLKTMGKSFNETDPGVLAEMSEKLNALAPNVRLISDSNTQDYIISGEAAVGFLYTSQVISALTARPDLKVVYPEEGLGFGIMGMFMPSQAPHSDAAQKFINYILEPEVSAKCFEYIGYVCTNQAAVEYLPGEMKESLSLPEGAAEGEFIMEIGSEANEIHEKAWTDFKAKLD